MGDVKLTPRQTADILDKLDDGLKSVAEAREQVIQAMADRRLVSPRKPARKEPRRLKKPDNK